MKVVLRNTLLAATTILMALFLSGCDGLEGNKYQAAGGFYQLEFQAGGKAIETFGPLKQTCSWVEKGSSVSVKCEDVTAVFTINAQGQLVPAPGGILGEIGPLTKKQ